MCLLQLVFTWYMLEGKLPTGISKTQIYLDEVALFWMSQWASCKRPIEPLVVSRVQIKIQFLIGYEQRMTLVYKM